MCGIVCFYGPSEGVSRVLDALELLAYRAPDSSGLAILGEDGRFAIRRAVGSSEQLRKKIDKLPLPGIRTGNIQVVMGHGRWAMVGVVNETNAHPLSDRNQDRVVCENGSHNASLMLGAFAEQERWWRTRDVPEDEAVHRSENTTEVIAYEWERMAILLAERRPPPGSDTFLHKLDAKEINDPEERALRLAIWRLREGNAHACAFYSRHRPDKLFVSSHNKPLAIAIRRFEDGSNSIMVASDVNAALMLWSKEEVRAAAKQIDELQQIAKENPPETEQAKEAILGILNRFTIEVFFLDNDLYQGEELFARIGYEERGDRISPTVVISRYDGTTVPAIAQTMRLNPAMVGKRGYASYTESHIAEIPDVLDGIITHYLHDGEPAMESVWQKGQLLGPGLNIESLVQHFGPRLESLGRVLLIGEGSSWRNAQAAAALFRQMLPGVLVNVYRPVEVLNLGQAIDKSTDLAIEISWSGTTDSLLKVDKWLGQADVMRLSITGRPQSDLGRRTAGSGGTLDVLSGVEVSVATVKGFEAILMVLDLVAIFLASIYQAGADRSVQGQLIDELSHIIPRHIRSLINDQERRGRLREVVQRCRHFNKVVVIGNGPVDVEAELKIEELAQVVARTSDFQAASLRPLIERSAVVADDRHRVFFIVNATSAEAQAEAEHVINYLAYLGVFCLIHTTPSDQLKAWQRLPNSEVFVSPRVSGPLQALIDAPFFFDLAVAFAYGRGLSADEIDRPRNLAKSVTVTGAERREMVEARQEFVNISLAEFGGEKQAEVLWGQIREGLSPHARQVAMTLQVPLAVMGEPLPEELALPNADHLVVVTDDEALEIGTRMAAATWFELLAIDLTVYRRFIDELPKKQPNTALLIFIRAGGFLAIRDSQTIAFPTDLSPWILELLGAIYLAGLGVRMARQRGVKTIHWEAGLARLPLVISQILANEQLEREIGDFLKPLVTAGYDKAQIIGGGQDHAAAASIAHSFRSQGFLAEALYTDSAWHGPLATVGGPDAEHDTVIIILATDPLFQAAALVDTQVYRTRNATVLLIVPEGNQNLPAVRGVDATAVIAVPAAPRPFLPAVNMTVGSILAQQMSNLWEMKGYG